MAKSKFWIVIGLLIFLAIIIAGGLYYFFLFPKSKIVNNTTAYKVTIKNKIALPLLIGDWLKYGFQPTNVWVTQPVLETKQQYVRDVVIEFVDAQAKALYLSDDVGRTVGFTSSVNGSRVTIMVNPDPSILSRSDPNKTFSRAVALAVLSVLKPNPQSDPQNMAKETTSLDQKLNFLKSPMFNIRQN